MNKPRVALVVSHPIQHFCPQYASLAKSEAYEFKVFFASKMGAVAYEDRNFQQRVQWSNLHLDSFDHEFLNEEVLPSSRSLDAPKIEQELDDYNADAVIIYGYWQRFQKRVRKWAKSRRRLVYYISDSENHGHETRIKRLLKSFRQRRLFRGIDRFFTVGNANEFYYHRHGVATHRMTRMQFSIDVDLYETAYKQRKELRKETRQALNISDDCTVIATAGKLVPWKRQRDAVKAMARLDSEIKATLLVLGSGPDEEALKRSAEGQCTNRVRFEGFVTPDELPKYYSAADIYLHCSDYEPHSLAISEAIYMGLPLIISDQCGSYGPLDDLQPGINGFVYPTRQVDSLASTIKTLSSNIPMQKAFAKASREYAVAAQERAHDRFLVQALRADNLLTC